MSKNESLVEKLSRFIAWLLPRRVVYWSYIRLHAHATCTTYSHRTPHDVSWVEALESWNTQKAVE